MTTLQRLSDKDLHQQTQALVSQERQLLTKILRHLNEIERRKLFCDFACSSLFDYAVKKLGYSEGQAHRRIQAMRLMRELPQVESKIAGGSLSLSNIAQAQSVFNELKKQNENRGINKEEKRSILMQLENKSAREARKTLLKLKPEAALPKEKEKQVTETKTEVKFLLEDTLRAKLEEVRSLLGPKGASMSYAELFTHMADLSVGALKSKKFGKKRAGKVSDTEKPKQEAVVPKAKVGAPLPTSQVDHLDTSRYVAAKVKHEVWQRDGGRCRQCGSQRNLNIDHVVPIARNGRSDAENLRLLCFQCNQRAAMKVFGVSFMARQTSKAAAAKS